MFCGGNDFQTKRQKAYFEGCFQGNRTRKELFRLDPAEQAKFLESSGSALMAYAMLKSYAEGYNYPYFFLNRGSPAGAFGFSDDLPYMGSAWWIPALFCALLIVGFLYLLILDVLKKLFRITSYF